MKRLQRNLLLTLLIMTSLLTNTSAEARMDLNNPGNIEHGPKWIGRSKDQPHKRFVKFQSPEYGYRAMCRILQTYSWKYKLNTITGIIKRYAPPIENPTSDYIWFVSEQSKFKPDEVLDLNDPDTLFRIVKAMAQFENGSKFHSRDSTIKRGCALVIYRST